MNWRNCGSGQTLCKTLERHTFRAGRVLRHSERVGDKWRGLHVQVSLDQTLKFDFVVELDGLVLAFMSLVLLLEYVDHVFESGGLVCCGSLPPPTQDV